MFYKLLRCIFFYDKPFLEITWFDGNTTKTKVMYSSEFKLIKTMDDLLRFAEMPLYLKYTILTELAVVHPWESVRIISKAEIVFTNKRRIHLRMKRLYGS